MDIDQIYDFIHLRAGNDGHLPRQVLAEVFKSGKGKGSQEEQLRQTIYNLFWDERSSYVEQLIECCGDNVIKVDDSVIAYCTKDVELTRTLEEIGRISERMISLNTQPGTVRRIVLVTDKWDGDSFASYRDRFIENAFRSGIWFQMLLVSDFGLAEIPFLPRDTSCRSDFEIEEAEL